jgi:gliding motility-associated-like protein
MRQLLSLFLAISLGHTLIGQTAVSMTAYYHFDQTINDITGNTANAGIAQSPPQYGCGVNNEALNFSLPTSFLRIAGPAREEFDTENFSLAFYFRATSNDGIQYLFSKRRKDCLADNSIYIRYRPSTRNINVVLTESADRSVNIVHELPLGTCWYHIAIVRDAGNVKLYVNGQLAREQTTFGRIDLRNDGDILIGASQCYGPNETFFKGAIDELRIYSRALNRFDVQGLLRVPPDKITVPDTIVFLNNPVNLAISQTCGTSFRWTPATNLTNPAISNPTFDAARAGNFVYAIQIGDPVSACVATDSIRITVIDPNSLDCGAIFLPKAFTPNQDGLNDTYGISNPYALQKLIRFEIFDRWGSRVFSTEDPFEQWDGSFLGKTLDPGVMVYKVEFECNGDRKLATGSFVIMK